VVRIPEWLQSLSETEAKQVCLWVNLVYIHNYATKLGLMQAQAVLNRIKQQSGVTQGVTGR